MARNAIVFVFTFVLALLVSKSATAHDIGWRWQTSTVRFQNINTSYGSAICRAAANYDGTDLTAPCVSNWSSNEVINYYQGTYGSGYDMGWAVPYYDSQPCVTAGGKTITGNCNTTTHKANFAEVFFNLTYQNGINLNSDWLPRHESGHVLGLAHGGCSEVSIMRIFSCSSLYSTLQTHDIATMNSWY